MGSPFIRGSEVWAAGLPQPALDGLAPALARFLRVLHSPRARDAVAGIELPADAMGRADMARVVARLADTLPKLAGAGLWAVPPAARTWLDAASGLAADDGAVLVHGDLHFRHLLVDQGAATGVIDWIDVGLASPAVDLVLYWSLFAGPGRAAFLEEYGPVPEHRLLRARALSLWLCGVLALYADATGDVGLRAGALEGLARTVAE
jgi:aminoglycoside phosphotransferase (APT) family kinase protein